MFCTIFIKQISNVIKLKNINLSIIVQVFRSFAMAHIELRCIMFALFIHVLSLKLDWTLPSTD